MAYADLLEVVVLVRVSIAYQRSGLLRRARNDLALLVLLDGNGREALAGKDAVNLGVARTERLVADGTARVFLLGTGLVGQVAKCDAAEAVLVDVKGDWVLGKVAGLEGAALGFAIELGLVNTVDLDRL